MTAPVTCAEADRLRADLRPLSSLTNYMAGGAIDPRLPPRTETTWGRDDGTEVLREVLDADGCRHYRIEEPTPAPVCPECSAGKHGNCNGDAWDDTTDQPAACACADNHEENR